jgi:triphosphatase
VKGSPAKWSRPPIEAHAATRTAFSTLCTAALAQIAANAPVVAHGGDAEYLHQLRVGLRRLLSAMRIFSPLLRRKRAKALRRRLRDDMQVFGAARDWDVFLVTLTRAGAGKALVQSAVRRHAGAAMHARSLAGSAAFREMQDRVRRWLRDGPWRSSAPVDAPVLDFTRDALDRAYRRLRKRAHGVDWRNRQRRHGVRIALKRLRYGCDFFADCFAARSVGSFVRRLGALQNMLGELNDIAVANTLLGELYVDGKSVRRRLARRELDLIASLSGEWAAFARMRPYWRGVSALHVARRTPRPLPSRA